MTDYLFQLPPNSSSNLQGQVREMLVTAILDGHIPPGHVMPSGRKLSTQLGLSRNTIVLAYERLVDEGFLVSRERSGYFVCADISAGRVAAAPSVHAPEDTVWNRPLRLVRRPSHQRNIEKPLDWQRYEYPFLYGQFDPALFPMTEWRDCCRRAMSGPQIQHWAGDGIDSDDPLLVEEIRNRLLPRRGVWVPPEQILVTVGAQHALYLLASLLVDSSTAVGIEEPGYVDARNIFGSFTNHLIPLTVDDKGLVVEDKLDQCRYVFATPSHQYPSTVTMPLDRRLSLLKRAKTSDFLIIEDDYEAETNYVGQPTPALKSLDHDQRVIYVSSLSKTLAPGLRIGFLVGPRELIDEARALRRLMLRHPPRNNERSAALFLAHGHHDALVRRLSHAFRKRWELMGEMLELHLPHASRPPTFGGTAYWVRGPEGLIAEQLAQVAAKNNILIEPGTICYMSRDPPQNHFRLGFSSIPVEKIEPGIRKLSQLIAELGS